MPQQTRARGKWREWALGIVVRTGDGRGRGPPTRSVCLQAWRLNTGTVAARHLAAGPHVGRDAPAAWKDASTGLRFRATIFWNLRYFSSFPRNSPLFALIFELCLKKIISELNSYNPWGLKEVFALDYLQSALIQCYRVIGRKISVSVPLPCVLLILIWTYDIIISILWPSISINIYIAVVETSLLSLIVLINFLFRYYYFASVGTL